MFQRTVSLQKHVFAFVMFVGVAAVVNVAWYVYWTHTGTMSFADKSIVHGYAVLDTTVAHVHSNCSDCADANVLQINTITDYCSLNTAHGCTVLKNAVVNTGIPSINNNCSSKTDCVVVNVVPFNTSANQCTLKTCSFEPEQTMEQSIFVSRFYRQVKWSFEFGFMNHWKHCLDHNTYDIGIFPRHIQYLENIYFMFWEVLGPLLQSIPSYVFRDGKHKIGLVLPVKDKGNIFTPFLKTLNITNVEIHKLDKEQVCFKMAVSLKLSEHFPLSKKMVNLIKNRLNISDDECLHNQITLIQRLGSRKIVNMDEIVQMLDSKFKKGNNTRVVNLEAMTIKEQIQTLHCSSILLGVQGAALGWLLFLPPKAKLVEVWFHEWHSKYVGRAHSARPDILGVKLKCNTVTTEEVWLATARYFGIEEPFSEKLKQKVIKRGEKSLFHDNVWKRSDVACDISDTTKAFKTVI